MTRRLVLFGAAVMATLLGLAMLWQFRIVVIYVLISLLIAATFRPVVKTESRRGVFARLLLLLKYVVGFGVAILLIYLVGRFLSNDFQQLVQSLSVESAWKFPTWLQNGVVQKWLPTPSQLFDALTSQRQLALSVLLGVTQGLGDVLSGLIVILFLSVYWSLNHNHFERLWLSLLPAGMRQRARYIWRTVDRDLGAYTRSELIQSMIAVLLLGLGYRLLGSPYPALLAVTGAVAFLIPVIGPVLAAILPLLLGLLIGPQVGLFTILYTFLVAAALQFWVEPRLIKLRWDNPVLTFIILLAMADAFGILGIIASPPLSVVCQILWKFLVTDRVSANVGVQVADLKEQHARLQTAIAEMEGPPPQLVVSSMERLTGLIDKAEPLLKESQSSARDSVFHAGGGPRV